MVGRLQNACVVWLPEAAQISAKLANMANTANMERLGRHAIFGAECRLSETT
jgi:hypothetical protein